MIHLICYAHNIHTCWSRICIASCFALKYFLHNSSSCLNLSISCNINRIKPRFLKNKLHNANKCHKPAIQHVWLRKTLILLLYFPLVSVLLTQFYLTCMTVIFLQSNKFKTFLPKLMKISHSLCSLQFHYQFWWHCWLVTGCLFSCNNISET